MESKKLLIIINTRDEVIKIALKNEINEPIDKIFKRWACGNLNNKKYYSIYKSYEFEDLEFIPCFNIFEHKKYVYSENKA